MTRIRLSELREVAKGRPGMFDDFIKAGRIQGAELALEREEFDRLQGKYFPGLKLGTLVHEALKPIVAAVKAVAPAAGKKLEGCAGCTGRELKMNAASSSAAANSER